MTPNLAPKSLFKARWILGHDGRWVGHIREGVVANTTTVFLHPRFIASAKPWLRQDEEWLVELIETRTERLHRQLLSASDPQLWVKAHVRLVHLVLNEQHQTSLEAALGLVADEDQAPLVHRLTPVQTLSGLNGTVRSELKLDQSGLSKIWTFFQRLAPASTHVTRNHQDSMHHFDSSERPIYSISRRLTTGLRSVRAAVAQFEVMDLNQAFKDLANFQLEISATPAKDPLDGFIFNWTDPSGASIAASISADTLLKTKTSDGQPAFTVSLVPGSLRLARRYAIVGRIDIDSIGQCEAILAHGEQVLKHGTMPARLSAVAQLLPIADQLELRTELWDQGLALPIEANGLDAMESACEDLKRFIETRGYLLKHLARATDLRRIHEDSNDHDDDEEFDHRSRYFISTFLEANHGAIRLPFLPYVSQHVETQWRAHLENGLAAIEQLRRDTAQEVLIQTVFLEEPDAFLYAPGTQSTDELLEFNDWWRDILNCSRALEGRLKQLEHIIKRALNPTVALRKAPLRKAIRRQPITSAAIDAPAGAHLVQIAV